MLHKILLVEDNEKNRKLALRFLSDDFTMFVAENGQKGVELAIEMQPDLILMDLNLPIMSGWEASQVLKANEKTKHIPIIALTAHAMKEDEVKAIDAGCDDFQTKPIDFDLLFKKINGWLLKRAA